MRSDEPANFKALNLIFIYQQKVMKVNIFTDQQYEKPDRPMIVFGS